MGCKKYLGKLCFQPRCGGSALHCSQTLLLLELADAQPVVMQVETLQYMQCCSVARDSSSLEQVFVTVCANQGLILTRSGQTLECNHVAALTAQLGTVGRPQMTFNCKLVQTANSRYCHRLLGCSLLC